LPKYQRVSRPAWDTWPRPGNAMKTLTASDPWQ